MVNLFLGASRARALSTFMDVSSIDCPKANSTFVVKKNCLENVEECLSPQMFSPVKSNETYIKPNNSDKTNSMASTSKTNVTKKLSKNINLLPEEPSPIKSNSNITTNKSSTKATTKKKGYILLFVQNNNFSCILIQFFFSFFMFIIVLLKFICILKILVRILK